MRHKNTRAIFDVFQRNDNFLAKESLSVDKNRINRLIENLYSPGMSFQYVFDFPSRKFTYVSEGVKELFGIKPEDFQTDDFTQRFHPDDIPHFLKSEEIATHFLFNQISKTQIPFYKISYQLRIKRSNGQYRLFLHQAIALTMDDEMNLGSAFVNHSDISHITSVNIYKLSLIHILGGESYYNIKTLEDLKPNKNEHSLTNSEMDILRLVSEGLSSKEIGDYLHISQSTVQTHRKNILTKTSFKNLTEAVSYYIKDGLI